MVAKERAAQVRRANDAFTRAGKAQLEPLGLLQREGSARNWFYDGGWYLVHVIFESSTHSLASTLLMGVQHLWHETEDVALTRLDQFGRMPPSAQLDSSDVHVAAAVSSQAVFAAAAFTKWRGTYADDGIHLTSISMQVSTSNEILEAAFAAGVLGQRRHSSQLFTRAIWLPEKYDGDRERNAMCVHLAKLVKDKKAFPSEVNRRIAATRGHLGLEPTTHRF